MLKERPPSGEGERRSYSCQCVSTGRMTRGHQDSTRSCESCRTRSERRECAFPEPSFVPHRALMPYYRERKGSSRQAASSVGVQNKHPMFPKALQSSTTLRDTFSGQHQTLDFSKCATDNCSKFCYERKESGEPCVLRVSQLGATELVWGHNGTVIHRGQDNCVEFTASYHTAGIYICFQKGAEKLLLVHVISMKEKEKGSRPQPLGKDELFLPPDLDRLSDAYSDNDPVPCPECQRRGTIFLNTGGTELSQVCGKTVTVRVHVCPQEKNKFHFMWQCNNVNFPKENGFSLTFEALTTAYCVCIAVNPSSRKEVDRSVVFEVLPTGASASSSTPPLTDPTVRQEVTPSFSQEATPQPSASQLAGTASSLSSQLNLAGLPGSAATPFGIHEEEHHSFINPSNMVFSSVHQSNPTVFPAAGKPVRRPPHSEPDTEPQSPPSDSFKVEELLTQELVRSDVFKHPRFNLSSLADSPTCYPCIRDLIRREIKSLPYISERHMVENVVQRISQDSTLDAIGIRRCVALMYMLIRSLQDDKQNAFHQSLGTHLMQKAPFPPMLLSWSPGPSLSLPRGEYVTLSVTACNADRFNWLCNRSRFGVPFLCHSGSSYRFPVDPSTCGVYQCSVGNRHGCVHTPPTEISMSDEPTSSSITEVSYEMAYNVDLPHEPSTSLAECATPCGSVGRQEVAPVEDERHANDGRHGEMVVGNRQLPRTVTERVVSGTMSNNDCRRVMMTQPTGLNQPDTPLYMPSRLPSGPPSPYAYSNAFRPPHSKRH